MERCRIAGCKREKLAGCDWEITLVIVGIDLAKYQGINIADYN